MKLTEIKKVLPLILASSALVISGCGGQTDASTDAYVQGMAALESNNYSSAIEDFQTAIDEDGREAEGLRGQGIAYLHLGEYATAADTFEKAMSAVRYPDQNEAFLEDLLFYQAQAYVEDGQNDKAMTLYNRLLSGKKSGQAYLLRGKLYAEMDKFGQAGQDFQKAIEADGSYEIYLQVYDVYVSNNRQADGATFLKDAVGMEPKTGEDYYQLGRISYELKDFQKAEEYLNKAVEAKVRNAIMMLGKVYLEDGNLPGARTLYNNCISGKEAVAIGYNGLALCDISEENYESALANIRNGLAADDNNVKEELLFNEIVVYERMHDFTTAAAKIKEFLAAFPTNEAAARENLFIQSRVTEAEAAVNETEIDWDEVARQQAEAEAEAVQSDSTAEAPTEGAAEDAGAQEWTGTDPGFVDLDGDGIADDVSTYADGTYYDGTDEQYYNAAYDASDW